MSKRITIDPVTRIEGHLRIDVEVDGGKVQKAWSSGTMWRGIELIVKDRDPRGGFTQRVHHCHAIAFVCAENAGLGYRQRPAHPKHHHRPPCMITAALYHLSALDWVDVVSALKADPAKASSLAESLSPWPGNSRRQLEAVKEKVKGFVESGQLGIFTNGYWGHPAMKLPPEVNLLAVSHYLQALDFQRKANQVVAILGSKTPNIQNLAVGGVANAINLDSPSTLNMEKLFHIKTLLDDVKSFIDQVYLPDVAAIASFYPEWLGFGAGVTNYLAVPDLPLDTKGTQFELPGGTIMGSDLAGMKPITQFGDTYFRDNVAEGVAHAWYKGESPLHPFEGETVPEPGDWKEDGKYSWVKAPRFQGKRRRLSDVGGSGRPAAARADGRWAWVLDIAGGLPGPRAEGRAVAQNLESTLAGIRPGPSVAQDGRGGPQALGLTGEHRQG
jgi:hydrogenase large subunit